MNRADDAGERLFRLIESDQGYSYISDDVEGRPLDDLIEVAEISLAAHRRCRQQARELASKKSHMTPAG